MPIEGCLRRETLRKTIARADKILTRKAIYALNFIAERVLAFQITTQRSHPQIKFNAARKTYRSIERRRKIARIAYLPDEICRSRKASLIKNTERDSRFFPSGRADKILAYMSAKNIDGDPKFRTRIDEIPPIASCMTRAEHPSAGRGCLYASKACLPSSAWSRRPLYNRSLRSRMFGADPHPSLPFALTHCRPFRLTLALTCRDRQAPRPADRSSGADKIPPLTNSAQIRSRLKARVAP